MEPFESEFLDSLKSLSTAKDKIFEISSIMLNHQSSHAEELVALWLKEFNSLKDERKRLAMLFVMNDAIIKSSKETRTDEYVKEFPKVMQDIIHSLVEFKSELMLEEFRKIVMVWENPAAMLYVPQYTSQLKADIQEGINAIQDDRTGASVIQEFMITKRLKELENKHEANLELAKRVEALTEKPIALKDLGISNFIEDYREKCEDELVERSEILLELGEMLEKEYKIYCGFNERIEEIRNSRE
jgi:hypothetical protein